MKVWTIKKGCGYWYPKSIKYDYENVLYIQNYLKDHQLMKHIKTFDFQILKNWNRVLKTFIDYWSSDEIYGVPMDGILESSLIWHGCLSSKVFIKFYKFRYQHKYAPDDHPQQKKISDSYSKSKSWVRLLLHCCRWRHSQI